MMKFTGKSSYSQTNEKDSDESFSCKILLWMKTQNDDREDYWGISDYDYNVKLAANESVDNTDVHQKNTMSSDLGTFILRKSKRIMNNHL